MFRLGMEGFEGNHSVMRVSDFIESWFKLRHGLGFGVQSLALWAGVYSFRRPNRAT